MSEANKNTPEEMEAVNAENLEDTVETANETVEAEPLIKEAATEEANDEAETGEEAAEAVAAAPAISGKKHRLSYE